MLRILTIGRSLSGIYRELRQIRRLVESYFTFHDIPLPATPYERFKEVLTKPINFRAATELESEPGRELTEDELAKREVARIMTDIAEGRDPGTNYRPW